MKINRLAFLFLILLDGCVDRFDIPITAALERLVVDGLITDQPGPYTVKLYNSIPLQDQLEKINWVTGASVTLFDNEGNTEWMTETSPGNYQTTAGGMQGVIGKSYYIRIVLRDDTIYESEPELLQAPGEITSLYYEFHQNENPYLSDKVTSTNGFQVFLDAKVDPSQPYIRWRWTGTFSIRAYPEFQVKYVPIRTPVPDPPPCSGYIAPRGRLENVGPCTCCTCWFSDHSVTPLLSDKKFIGDGTLTRIPLAFVEASRRTMHEKYFLAVEQMSVSEVAYDFWTKVKKQQAIGSDLFQTPPAATLGNITRVSDSGIPVIGLFGASAIRTEFLTLDKTDLPYPLGEMDSVRMSCTRAYRVSVAGRQVTTEKPPFW